MPSQSPLASALSSAEFSTRPTWTLTATEASSLISKSTAYVTEYMSAYDPSHDMSHIERVVSLTLRLLSTPELASEGGPTVDGTLVHLSALLHDVGDKKYAAASSGDPAPVQTFLLSIGAPEPLAAAVQTVASHVSFSNERKNPESVGRTLRVYPELALVQDADRIDAAGAVGVGRAFVFTGAMSRARGMQGAVEHFVEKLERLAGMCKTELGRKIAEERVQRIKVFRGWWEEEVGFKTAGAEDS